MLKDELQAVRALMTGSPAVSVCRLKEVCDEVTRCWSAARFSDAPEHSFRRYLNYHLAAVTAISDDLAGGRCAGSPCLVQQALLGLTDHLLFTYPECLDTRVQAPLAFTQRAYAQMALKIQKWKPSEDRPVLDWLSLYLLKPGAESPSFDHIGYLADLVSELGTRPRTEEELVCLLISNNFNHLGFYRVLTQKLSGRGLAELKRKRADLMGIPSKTGTAFDPSWISLKEMLGGWLNEELILLESPAAETRPAEKLYLDLSVAHLACFVRLFYEEGLMASASLTDIFRAMCGSFRTKRQPAISQGSFSKEFYSINQETAARVRDLLQRMLARVNRKYFP
jgi:hypothetical protein